MLGASLHLIVLTCEIMLRIHYLYTSILTLVLSILMPIKHKKVIYVAVERIVVMDRELTAELTCRLGLVT